MNSNTLDIQALLSTPSNFVIVPHTRPDADALGSSMALFYYLRKRGHEVVIISPSEYPSFLYWMCPQDAVLVYQKERSEEIEARFKEAAYVFCLDFSDPKRCAPLDGFFMNKKPVLLIDHHLGKLDFAVWEHWNTKAAATAELIYELILGWSGEEYLDISIGKMIYAGIMTDTGSFKHPSTTANVHRITAHLLELGVDTASVHRNIYDTNTENRLRFLGHAFSQRLEVLPEYHTAFFCITSKDLKDFQTRMGDTEGLVNYALSIEGIVLAACFIEYDGEIRISLRSFGDFSVAEMSRLHFNGGGHKNAAGGKCTETLSEVRDHFLSLLPNAKEALLRVSSLSKSTL